MSEEHQGYGDDELETGSLNKSDGLARLSGLVTEMARDGLEIERAKADLKEKEEKYQTLTRIVIPDLMQELGQDKCKTTSGLEISVKRKVKASITNKNRAEAVAWFKEQNLERMLKDEFTLKLGKVESEEKAQPLREAIEALGLDYENKKTCHHGTLSAFVRERDEAGEFTPDKILSVFRYKEAKIG